MIVSFILHNVSECFGQCCKNWFCSRSKILAVIFFMEMATLNFEQKFLLDVGQYRKV